MARRSTLRLDSFVAPSSVQQQQESGASETEYTEFIASVRRSVEERLIALTAPNAPPLSYDVVYTACSCGAALPLRMQRERARVTRYLIQLTLFYCAAISLLAYFILYDPVAWYYYVALWSPVLLVFGIIFVMLHCLPKRVKVREQRRALSPLQEDYDALLPAHREYADSVQNMRADAQQKWVNSLVDTIVRGQLIAVTEEHEEEWMQALDKENHTRYYDHLVYDMHADADESTDNVYDSSSSSE